MKIIKRNGSEAVFDITKIIAAITKANDMSWPESQRLTTEQIIEISDHVQTSCHVPRPRHERGGDPGPGRG